jgi:hypothetical protein
MPLLHTVPGDAASAAGAGRASRTHTVRVLNPSFLAFVGSSCVGCPTNPQVRALGVLANESCCRNYCGRTADGRVEMGYGEVYNLGGFKDWADSGGAIDRAEA